MKKIIIINKKEQDKNELEEKISNYIQQNPSIDSIKVSLKTLDNIPELNSKILQAYEIKKDSTLESDYVLEEEESLKNPFLYQGLKTKATINIVIVGESEVGKSCFMLRYFRDQFNETFLTTVGMDKEVKIVKIKDDIFRLTFWDTAGQERFRSLPSKYYQNSDGCILMFDLNREISFERVNVWAEDLKRNISGSTANNLFLIGNKLDLKREVKKEDALKKAEELKMQYFEVSCKTGINVPEVMNKIIYKCSTKFDTNNGVKLDKIKKEKKKKCC